jgi:hypothetical protein
LPWSSASGSFGIPAANPDITSSSDVPPWRNGDPPTDSDGSRTPRDPTRTLKKPPPGGNGHRPYSTRFSIPRMAVFFPDEFEQNDPSPPSRLGV